jgi:transketolase
MRIIVGSGTDGTFTGSRHSRYVSPWGGSADLAGSTTVEVDGARSSATNSAAKFIRFGIREHAMAAIINGIALQAHGARSPPPINAA